MPLLPSRPAAIVVLTLALGASPAGARQDASPNLTRPQRAALQAVVRAVDAAADAAPTADIEWPLHVLRASDGSHYVAFSLIAPPALPVNRPVMLYVRLATHRDARLAASTERSAIGEWLAGQRTSLPPPRRGIAIGEMPTFGAGAAASRPQASQSLQLLEHERRRARERREDEERERKAQLESDGTVRGPNPLLPFEDFDLQAVAEPDGAGAPVLRRSLTVGPGDYELLVGWVDPSARDLPAAVHVVKRMVRLDAASTSALALSSVIVADAVRQRETPLGAAEQTAHPYSIGHLDIVPARDHVLTGDDRLTLAVQIINPAGSAQGKPDVTVGFNLFRATPTGQETVGKLAPQVYDQSTVPIDFDIAKRHPIFAAVAVPLQTFKRGVYRMEITARDRLAGATATTDVSFTVVGTPAALLGDAPPLGPGYRRDAVLAEPTLAALLAQLRPAAPSSAMAAALDTARARRFIDLVRDDDVAPAEAGARTLLRALGLYALGDTPASLAGPLRLASQQGGPAAAVHLLTGAVRALEGHDADAVASWQRAMADGIDAAALAPLLVDAALRQGDWTRAADLTGHPTAQSPRGEDAAQQAAGSSDARLTRQGAAARIGAGREAEAVALLEKHLTRQPDDVDAQWLLLHALFSGFVKGESPGSEAAGRTRFAEIASLYLAAGGAHAALAREWRDAIF